MGCGIIPWGADNATSRQLLIMQRSSKKMIPDWWTILSPPLLSWPTLILQRTLNHSVQTPQGCALIGTQLYTLKKLSQVLLEYVKTYTSCSQSLKEWRNQQMWWELQAQLLWHLVSLVPTVWDSVGKEELWKGSKGGRCCSWLCAYKK